MYYGECGSGELKKKKKKKKDIPMYPYAYIGMLLEFKKSVLKHSK